MGRIKDYLMDLEEVKSLLVSIVNRIHLIENHQLFSMYAINIDKLDKVISMLLSELYGNKDKIDITLIDFINNQIRSVDSALDIFLANQGEQFTANILIKTIDESFAKYSKLRILKDNNINIEGVNTEKFYEDKIRILEKKEKELSEKLKITEGKTQEEINQAKLEVEVANKKIFEYKNELELKQRQEDAKENWKKNIVETFENLKTYLLPIKDEHIRLNCLFWVYLVMSILLVIAVIIIEWIAVCHIATMPDLADFKTYILIYLPLPVAGALLWGFIYQMNRAQRQLVVIAKSIHKVEYVQGLLLSVNKLAPTVEDGITRINAALDKLINNHLNEKEVNTEEDIIKEEKKDVVPVETIIRLLKEVKGVVGKE